MAAGTDAKAGGPAKGAATKGAARRTSTTRRSVKGRPRRLHPSAGSRARHSLGGRLVGLRRPRTAPAKEPTPSAAAATAAAAPAAAPAAAQASADATNSDDEFSGEAWRSGADALSKPLPQMNVFSRLSDYRSFTGTHRATHATIALGRNEYHNADNSACHSIPRARVRTLCALCADSCTVCVCCCACHVQTCSAVPNRKQRRRGPARCEVPTTAPLHPRLPLVPPPIDAAAPRQVRARTHTSPRRCRHCVAHTQPAYLPPPSHVAATAAEKPAVFGRLADVKNFTGTHKHKHEELMKKAEPTGKQPKRPRTANAALGSAHAATSDDETSDGSDGGARDAAADPPSTPAAAAAPSSRHVRSKSTPDASPIRIAPSPSAAAAAAGEHAGVRHDPLGTSRLVDLLGPAPAREIIEADARPFLDAVSPHLNVEGRKTARADRARRGRNKARTKALARGGRSASYSPPLSPFAVRQRAVVGCAACRPPLLTSHRRTFAARR